MRAIIYFLDFAAKSFVRDGTAQVAQSNGTPRGFMSVLAAAPAAGRLPGACRKVVDNEPDVAYLFRQRL
jgi:hypothetical protein